MNEKSDLDNAKAVARQYGFAAGDHETCDGLVRNILTVLQGRKQLHEREVLIYREEVTRVCNEVEWLRQSEQNLFAELVKKTKLHQREIKRLKDASARKCAKCGLSAQTNYPRRKKVKK